MPCNTNLAYILKKEKLQQYKTNSHTHILTHIHTHTHTHSHTHTHIHTYTNTTSTHLHTLKLYIGAEQYKKSGEETRAVLSHSQEVL